MKPVLFLTLRADFGGGPEHLWQLLRHLPEETSEYQPHRRISPPPGNFSNPQWAKLACVFVACPEDYPYYERYRDRLGKENIFVLPHRKFSLSTLWGLRAFCRERGVAVLHSHGKGAGLYARILVLLTGLPCVHTFHGVHMREYGGLKRFLYRLGERVLSLATRAAITVSEGERAQILAEGLMPAARLHLILNGVEIPAATAGEAAGPPFCIISMSRFDYQKNSGFLADIAEALRQRGRLGEFRFVVVGDGPGRAGMLAAAQARGLSGSLECSGASPDPQAFFSGGLCYLSTSRWEGMPLAVLEAMAHGLPAVVTDTVGNRDAVKGGETGFVYPEGDADAAASALCRLADDPKLRRALGEQAREYTRQHHDAWKMATDTLELLQGIACETLYL
ncbi:MAG: glycosyltransferase [Deltaproteobacteria bacterium]|nr:glycosyltransferase [Deltaproteobacteria bacterium]